MRELALHILDLVENSLRAEASAITVAIMADAARDRLRIVIEDNGTGLWVTPAQALDPFYTTKRGKRTGLGLSLFRAAAERAGGSLRLEQATKRRSDEATKGVRTRSAATGRCLTADPSHPLRAGTAVAPGAVNGDAGVAPGDGARQGGAARAPSDGATSGDAAVAPGDGAAQGGAAGGEGGPGVRVTVEMGLRHIDRSPLGDLPGTLAPLVCTNPNVDFRFRLELDGRVCELHTAELARTGGATGLVLARRVREQLEEALRATDVLR